MKKINQLIILVLIIGLGSQALAQKCLVCMSECVTLTVVARGANGAAAADTSFAAVVHSILHTSGWRGLYRGFGVTLVAYLP